MRDLIWPLVLLFVLAVALRSELFFYLIYVVAGLQIAARLWLGRGVRQLSWRRGFSRSAAVKVMTPKPRKAKKVSATLETIWRSEG